MSHVQTVLGPVAPEQIGATDCHEHLFIRGGMPVLRYPDFRLDDYEKIAADAGLFKKAGGDAIVEMSPIDWGRDAAALERLARDTDLHIVAATGFHTTAYYSDIHWIYAYDEEQIARLVCDELQVGMDLYNYNGPLVRRIAARAGAIKVGTGQERFTDIERKLLRVVALAHLRTGAPIITHTHEGALALEQVTFLMDQGVRPSRIAISHMDRRLDLGYHKEVASTGAFLEYDGFTRVDQGLDRSTLRLVIEMCAAGHVGSILLGGDISRQKYWRSYGGGPGLDFVVGGFRAALADAGLPPEDVDAIYVRNPRALLTWSDGAAPGRRQAPATEADDEANVDGRRRGGPGGTLRTVDALVSRGLVTPEDRPALEQLVANFSLAITPDVAALLDGAGPSDPLARQFVPDAAELLVDEREISDPIGDAVHARTAAVIHRYPDRVLLKANHACPVYCRFCFRRETVGRGAERITEADVTEALSYVRAHPEIWEVILTGGDPLILSDRRLHDIFAALHDIEHVQVVRVHTRYPVALPRRITEGLVNAMKGRAAAYVVLHCNHPRELTEDALAACARLIDNGIPMLSQTVLLQGINDDSETLAELMRALVAARIKPYYLHHLDLARGTGHFRTTVAKGQDILRELRGHVSGLCQPTYVLDIPGGYGKVPIGPGYLRPAPSGVAYVVEDYQGRLHEYVDLGEEALEVADAVRSADSSFGRLGEELD